MEKFTCILIDPDDTEREKLADVLSETDLVDIVAKAGNTKQGLVLANDLEPNLLFVALKSGDLDAFKFLEKLAKQPTIVFLTDHELAIKTFEANQLHYLKKPVVASDVQQLISAFTQTHRQLATKMQGLLGKLKFED